MNVVSRLIALLWAVLVIGAIYIPSVGAKKVVNGTIEVPDTFMVPHKPSVDGGDTGVPYGFIKPKKPGNGDSGVPIGFIKPRRPVDGDSGVPSGFIKPKIPDKYVILSTYY